MPYYWEIVIDDPECKGWARWLEVLIPLWPRKTEQKTVKGYTLSCAAWVGKLRVPECEDDPVIPMLCCSHNSFIPPHPHPLIPIFPCFNIHAKSVTA